MIFTPEHIQMIAEGRKTQTRRVLKPNEHLIGYMPGTHYHRCVVTETPLFYEGGKVVQRRIKWQVWRDYAVQPGRGKPGAWALFDHPRHIIDVWMDMAQKVAMVDGDGEKMVDAAQIARGQGYEPLRIRITDIRRQWLQDISREDVKSEGVGGYTFAAGCLSDDPPDPRWKYIEIWDAINTRKGTRWQDNPPVWVLTFEVVRR